MLGMTDKQMREIDLGPRQIFMFDIEDDSSTDRKRLTSYLTDSVERLGQANLKDFVPSASEALGLDAATVLQHLFWLAYDVAIHFRNRHEAVTANQAKKMLIDLRQADLWVALNQPVDKAVFADVKDFFERIAPDMVSGVRHDQTELARCLAQLIRKWERTLIDCRTAADRPGFPGRNDIRDGLELITAISAKWDAFSLIHAVHAHIGPLGRVAETVEALAAFYANDEQRWHVLIQFAHACRNTIAAEKEAPAAASDFERLNMIISSSAPYARVDEAWQLYRSLKPFHDEIVARQIRQCRETARSRVTTLIQKMRHHLNTHGADDDLRNQSLFALRVKIRSIEQATGIDGIEHHLLHAEEAFESFWSEVAGQ